MTAATAFVFLGMSGLGAIVSLVITIAYIVINIPRGENAGSSGLALVKEFFVGLISVPVSLVQMVGKLFTAKNSTLIKKKQSLPSAALISPILPLLIIAIINFTIGFGSVEEGKFEPVGAAVLGFLIASFYAAILVRPSQAVNLFTGALVDGIKDIAGVLFLFMGIGMLVTATTQPAAVEILSPLMKSIMPSSFMGVIIFFTIFAPAALYRGPFNMYGMGSGIATILNSLNFLPSTALYGIFGGVGYIQTLADPTNSHNTWLAGYAGVDTNAVMKKILPYAWGACVLMMIVVSILR